MLQKDDSQKESVPLNENRLVNQVDSAKRWKMNKLIFVVILVVGVISIIVGIILWATYTETIESKVDYDYTNCKMFDVNAQKHTDITCAEFKSQANQTTSDCTCIIYLNITNDIYGDIPPIIYYELDTYDQTRNQTYIQSKDENQLTGNLSLTPAAQCEPYRYLNGTPIFPCGALAESIFNDTYIIRVKGNREKIPTVNYGMIKEDDKVGFRNPPGKLEEALKNFTKPPSWEFAAWQLDLENPENNGVQNERFIGWMKTSWKRKPYQRLNDTKLPKGHYMVRIDYYYPPTLYRGTRKLIISTYHIEANLGKRTAGIVFFSIGCVLALLSVTAKIIVYLKKR